MSENAEIAFVRTFLNTLSTQPITYENDYRQPLENSLKRVQVLPVPLPPPPKRQHVGSSVPSATLRLTFKSLKPPVSYTLTVSPTDTIATIKSQLSTTHNTSPPADAQRFIIKGKALADSKLLKEYNVQDGDTVSLMVRPGINWDPSKPKEEEILQPKPIPAVSGLSANIQEISFEQRVRHSRTPSIVLSPSPSSDVPGATLEKDILLTLDPEAPASIETLTTYHTTVANPDFWVKLATFFRDEFTTEADALRAWEDFLRATKASLTASEIARIRGHVGIMGMAGT